MTRMTKIASLPSAGGTAELLKLALPLIVSNSFWTLQVLIDRVLLSRYDSDAVAASMPAVLLYWTPFALVQYTANYAMTFVAQYHGAGRPRRIGPAVWQAFYFSLFAGIAFLGLRHVSAPLVALGEASPHVQALEVTYFNCLCFCALPALFVASASSFFAGRGETRTIIFFNAIGLVVTGLLDYAWIYGNWGFPEWGIAGAGWATVAGDVASALLALTLMLRRKYRDEFATLSGWRFDSALFRRLAADGINIKVAKSGLLGALDCSSFLLFTKLVERLGDVELAATSISFTINMVAILPMLGMGQAVCVLVGQRLGQDRPELAQRTTWTGFRLTLLYMATAAFLFVTVPNFFLFLFQGDLQSGDASQRAEVAAVVPKARPLLLMATSNAPFSEVPRV